MITHVCILMTIQHNLTINFILNLIESTFFNIFTIFGILVFSSVLIYCQIDVIISRWEKAVKSEILIRNEEKRRFVYRPFLRQCVRTQPNEQAATHGADKKEESLSSLSLLLYSVTFLYHKRNPLGAVAVCRGPSKGWPGEVGGERAGYGRVEGGCARGRAPEGGTREGIEAIDVFT